MHLFACYNVIGTMLGVITMYISIFFYSWKLASRLLNQFPTSQPPSFWQLPISSLYLLV